MNAAERILYKIEQNKKTTHLQRAREIINHMHDNLLTAYCLRDEYVSDATCSLLEQDGFTVKRVRTEADPNCPCSYRDDCKCGAETYSIVSIKYR